MLHSAPRSNGASAARHRGRRHTHSAQQKQLQAIEPMRCRFTQSIQIKHIFNVEKPSSVLSKLTLTDWGARPSSHFQAGSRVLSRQASAIASRLPFCGGALTETCVPRVSLWSRPPQLCPVHHLRKARRHMFTRVDGERCSIACQSDWLHLLASHENKGQAHGD